MTSKMVLAAAIVAAGALSAAAQETVQQTVVGASGDAVYSVQITGANSETYYCRPDIQSIEGRLVRRCVRQRAGVANGQLLGGELTPGALTAAVTVFVALAAGAGSSSTTTN